MITDSNHQAFDLTGGTFSFEKPQKLSGWIGSRFGALAYSLGKDPVIAHRLFQSYCDEPTGRLPASIQSVRLYRFAENVTALDRGLSRSPVVEHWCAN